MPQIRRSFSCRHPPAILSLRNLLIVLLFIVAYLFLFDNTIEDNTHFKALGNNQPRDFIKTKFVELREYEPVGIYRMTDGPGETELSSTKPDEDEEFASHGKTGNGAVENETNNIDEVEITDIIEAVDDLIETPDKIGESEQIIEGKPTVSTDEVKELVNEIKDELNNEIDGVPEGGTKDKVDNEIEGTPENEIKDELNSKVEGEQEDGILKDVIIKNKPGSTETEVESEAPANKHTTEKVTNTELQKRDILFLKTHKCGTSSMVNLFFLFGIRRKLNFVVEPFKRQFNIQARVMVPPRKGQHYNIQCLHSKFYPDYIHRYLPKNRTVYTTILRSPLKHFISGFVFFGADRTLVKEKAADGINMTLDDSVNEWLSSNPNFTPNSTHAHLSLYINGLALDLGFELFLNKSELNLQEKIDQFIQHIDEEFDLVMLTDFFDESLVLMKDLMNWRIEDVFYFNRMTSKGRKNDPLSPETVERIYTYNVIDVQLYNHFHRKFQKTVDQYGRAKLEDDVAEFRKLRLDFQNYCFSEDEVHLKFVHLKSSTPLCRFLKATDILMARLVSQLQITEDMTIPNINDTLDLWSIPRGARLESEHIQLVKQIQEDWVSKGYNQYNLTSNN